MDSLERRSFLKTVEGIAGRVLKSVLWIVHERSMQVAAWRVRVDLALDAMEPWRVPDDIEARAAEYNAIESRQTDARKAINFARDRLLGVESADFAEKSFVLMAQRPAWDAQFAMDPVVHDPGNVESRARLAVALAEVAHSGERGIAYAEAVVSALAPCARWVAANAVVLPDFGVLVQRLQGLDT